MKIFLVLGGLNGMLAVALGAFGAHGLKERLSADMLAVYQTGVQYQMYHALALILVAIISDRLVDSAMLSWSGWLFTAGIIIFSGSLYTLSTTGIKSLGAVAPIGGMAFIVAWVLLIIAAVRSL